MKTCLAPKIFVQSSHDEHGPRPELETIYRDVAEPKQIHWVEGADHFFAGKLDEVQAVLGEFPNAPAEFLVSNEADVFPRGHIERSELIDGTIGEGSPFQRSFGYYAHGVDETTAILPEGWRDRLILVTGENTRFVRGWCLETHDLAIAKYAAGREKDLEFTKALAREIWSRGITVNAVAPGYIETSMTDGLSEDQKKALVGEIVLGRLGTGADVAGAVVYLASDAAAYVTGTCLNVSGGLYIG